LLIEVRGHEHFLDAAEVTGEIVLEAAGDEGAGCVASGEEGVGAFGTVGCGGGGYVVDLAGETDVDWELGVGAVVGGKLLVCQRNGSELGNVSLCVGRRGGEYEFDADDAPAGPPRGVSPEKGVSGDEEA
jgi:hypothetical protein